MTTTLTVIVFMLVTQLSTPERHLIATTESSSGRNRQVETPRPVDRSPLIKKAIDGFSSLGDALAPVEKHQAAKNENRAEAPAAVVWVRISEPYLADYIERSVDRKKPVRDFILGTTINGE